MAVPGSLTAGDKARDAISVSTDSPKRGSWSKDRMSPTENASRALSPAVNDPGTAIDILGRATRSLATWAAPTPAEAQETPYPNVCVPGILVDDLFEDVFVPIARDGATLVEVALRVQKSLESLAGTGDARYIAAAVRQSDMALARAELALVLEYDRERIREAAARVRALADEPAGQPPA